MAQGQAEETESPAGTPSRRVYRPGHVLFTSHHLLAPSKRRDLASLASRYRLLGFGKVGHPGIIYAEGDVDDLEEFVREVKSWQWLALRLRVLEELGDHGDQSAPRTKGHWDELHKMGEAIAWLSQIGRQNLLLDIGFGANGGGTRG
jgi:hypothetical protein